MYRSILVPLDGSTYAEQVLEVACAIARHTRARLRLAHVHMRLSPDPIYIKGIPVIDEQLNSQARLHERAYLDRVCSRLSTVWPDLAIDTHLLEPGSRDMTVAGALTVYAASASVDLIVMSSHGRSGLARCWFGSVANALLQQCSLPILLPRPNRTSVGRPAGERCDPFTQYRRILVPLDGTEAAEHMVYRALTLGRSLCSDYALLRIVEPTVLFGPAPFTTPTDFDPDRTERLCREARADLARVAAWMRNAGAMVTTEVRVALHPATAILQAARDFGAGLIALETQRGGGLRRALFGSVADKIVSGAHLPVLIQAGEPYGAREAMREKIHR